MSDDGKVTFLDGVPLEKREAEFRELVEADYRLAALERRVQAHVKAVHRKRGYCANEFWYKSAKPELLRIVGWERGGNTNPLLRSSHAYDVAYDWLYTMLPDCSHAQGLCRG